jgi:YD repeat-containing protein
MWRFFETEHINMQPTYTSKYPPAQSAFLALGIRLFGHPWYGVLISVALMCGCICWMLQGWLPPKYALLGGIFAVLQFDLIHYWIDSYWGGAVAAMGGALVFGAVPRLAHRGKASVACAAAIGIAILANSRPLEGLILLFLASGTLLWWTRGRFRVWFRPAVLVPLAVILLSTASAMAFYNFKTTGNPTTLPYFASQQRYSAGPLLWIMPPYPPKELKYRDASMRELWVSWDAGHYRTARHNPLVAVFRLYDGIRTLVGAGAGVTLVLLVACAIPLAGILRLRFALGVLSLYLCAMALYTFIQAHYLAPGVAPFFVAAMFGLRLLRCHRLRGQRTGRALMASVISLAVVLSFLDSAMTAQNRARNSDPSSVGFRRQVTARLASEPGTHLVLVHYAPDHKFLEEIVYNSPDIDAQKIIWAFDFGAEADRPLLDYYRGRKVWLVRPDGPNPTLEPYSN